MARWRTSDIPDQSGRVAVVTGANSGLGYVTARELARHGATVVLACRDQGRGAAAHDRLLDEVPDARLDLRSLDLGDLASVAAFADAVAGGYGQLDLLVNNAGLMAVPRGRTADGFETQIGVNHLGHFALTGRLLPLLLDVPGARIVTVSSVAHKIGHLDLDDLNREQHYQRWSAYGQSKLANLMFAYELQRRLSTAGAALVSLAAHPGLSATNLTGPLARGNAVASAVLRGGSRVFGQSDEAGARPQLYAATSPEAHGGDYVGPRGIGEASGAPRLVDSSSMSKDPDLAAALWTLSCELTGVTYPL